GVEIGRTRGGSGEKVGFGHRVSCLCFGKVADPIGGGLGGQGSENPFAPAKAGAQRRIAARLGPTGSPLSRGRTEDGLQPELAARRVAAQGRPALLVADAHARAAGLKFLV